MTKRAGLLTAAVATAALLGGASPASAADAQQARDTTPPAGAVGGVSSPATGRLSLQVRATDSGLGLASATATLAGRTATASFGDAGCADRSPGSAAIDLPPCPATGMVDLPIDTTSIPDGDHHLLVTVSDAAGNVTRLVDGRITVLNAPPTWNPIVELDIGGGSGSPGAGGPGGGGSGDGGGVAGEQERSTLGCRAPRLSMFLAQRPLRTRRGVVVLRKGKRYRFRGRLTCRVGDRRRAAKRNTPIELVNRVGGRSIRKSGTTVRRNGRITVILAYRSARTIVFRYRAAGGKTSRVQIKIRVARRAR